MADFNYGAGAFNYGAQGGASLAGLKKQLQKEQENQLLEEYNKMRALALNGRPAGADGVSIAGGSLINAGGEIGRQQAYDRNMAAMHNPIALGNLMTKGSADVGGPRVRGRIHPDADRLMDDRADLDLEQLSTDFNRGMTADPDQIGRALQSTNKYTRSGQSASGLGAKAIERYNNRADLLGQPLPTETPRYQTPTYQDEPERQQYPGDVRPMKPVQMKISRDKKSLIPYYTNF